MIFFWMYAILNREGQEKDKKKVNRRMERTGSKMTIERYMTIGINKQVFKHALNRLIF